MTILFNLASRSRPQQFFEVIENIENMSASKDYFIVAKLDTDDSEMNNPEVRRRLKIYKNLIVKWGISASKMHAINRSLEDIPDWQILVNMSDDFRFRTYGFDDIIRSHMPNDLDAFIHFPDGYANERVCTMSILGRKYYDRDGYIYHSDYYSLWCDNEAQEVAQIRGKYKYINQQIIEHLHYSNHKAPKDLLYWRNDTYNSDKAVFEFRKSKNFDL